MDATTQNVDCNQTINQYGVELTSLGVGMNVKELSHTQQLPQSPETHNKKPIIRKAIRTVFCAPQRFLPHRFLVLGEVTCNTHTQKSANSSETA